MGHLKIRMIYFVLYMKPYSHNSVRMQPKTIRNIHGRKVKLQFHIFIEILNYIDLG